MAYTAENIANIKRAGDLESYIAHNEKMIASLEAAKTECNQQGEDSVSVAHLYGRFGIEIETAEPAAYAQVSYGDWTRSWPIRTFDNDQSRALSYARAALKSHIEQDAADLLLKFRTELKTLVAAR